MRKLQTIITFGVLLLIPGLTHAQTQPGPLLPPGQFPTRPSAGLPMMGGCCAMHGMMQKPPTGVQALQQAYTLLYALDTQLHKSPLKSSSAVRALRQDVKAMQQAGQAKNATLAQRKETTLQALQASITDLENVLSDQQVPAQARPALTAVLQQLAQLHELAKQ